MDVHERMQFDVFLGMAGEAFIARIVQRCGGQEQALARLQHDPNGDGVWRDAFVEALFADWCLDNPDGATYILRALASRPAVAVTGTSSVGESLQALSRSVFADLLTAKVVESMQRASAYGT